ncbi:hypothetical protein KIPB_000243 [Kipferlia bialata]|uniref:Uncharacterized protein n=1 Tax=Kipferlia bialata TaxID=797122 RepID=A0A9K3CNQ7_9EUKA|nr:hypothetical protein KIPB_000243 [Kipferlia bialata]|eukprot:g243.t1
MGGKPSKRSTAGDTPKPTIPSKPLASYPGLVAPPVPDSTVSPAPVVDAKEPVAVDTVHDLTDPQRHPPGEPIVAVSSPVWEGEVEPVTTTIETVLAHSHPKVQGKASPQYESIEPVHFEGFKEGAEGEEAEAPPAVEAPQVVPPSPEIKCPTKRHHREVTPTTPATALPPEAEGGAGTPPSPAVEEPVPKREAPAVLTPKGEGGETLRETEPQVEVETPAVEPVVEGTSPVEAGEVPVSVVDVVDLESEAVTETPAEVEVEEVEVPTTEGEREEVGEEESVPVTADEVEASIDAMIEVETGEREGERGERATLAGDYDALIVSAKDTQAMTESVAAEVAIALEEVQAADYLIGETQGDVFRDQELPEPESSPETAPVSVGAEVEAEAEEVGEVPTAEEVDADIDRMILVETTPVVAEVKEGEGEEITAETETEAVEVAAEGVVKAAEEVAEEVAVEVIPAETGEADAEGEGEEEEEEEESEPQEEDAAGTASEETAPKKHPQSHAKKGGKGGKGGKKGKGKGKGGRRRR